jgi:hypothetical protein
MDTCYDGEYACYAKYKLEDMRKDLDPKIADLYNPDSVRNITEQHYEASMLAGMFWATLGSAALYFAFTQM